MEQLLEILKGIKKEVDFKTATALVDDGVLDSLEIVEIITAIEDKYGIEINPDEIDPDNFQSLTSMWEMIQRIIMA